MLRAIVLLLLLFCNRQNTPTTGDLKVMVTGIRNSKGNINLSLFNSATGFPNDTRKALRNEILKINGNSAEFTFKDIPFGFFAVAAYHDENDNKQLDKNFLGIPKEGVGASNNAKGHMGPPKYEDAKFNFTHTGQVVSFSVSYL